jgi:hypothetical protein
VLPTCTAPWIGPPPSNSTCPSCDASPTGRSSDEASLNSQKRASGSRKPSRARTSTAPSGAFIDTVQVRRTQLQPCTRQALAESGAIGAPSQRRSATCGITPLAMPRTWTLKSCARRAAGSSTTTRAISGSAGSSATR